MHGHAACTQARRVAASAYLLHGMLASAMHGLQCDVQACQPTCTHTCMPHGHACMRASFSFSSLPPRQCPHCVSPAPSLPDCIAASSRRPASALQATGSFRRTQTRTSGRSTTPATCWARAALVPRTSQPRRRRATRSRSRCGRGMTGMVVGHEGHSGIAASVAATRGQLERRGGLDRF